MIDLIYLPISFEVVKRFVDACGLIAAYSIQHTTTTITRNPCYRLIRVVEIDCKSIMIKNLNVYRSPSWERCVCTT